jgi:hypothetical protein
LASLLLWNLPFGGFVLYPFKILATWLHENSHGLLMLLSGAGFDHLEIFRDTSGIAYAKSQVGPVARSFIASAGYMGTSAVGALLLVVGQQRRGARWVLGVLGAALAISAVAWVENHFGIVAVAIGAAASAALAAFASERVCIFSVNFIAAQACVNALLDIRVLLRKNLVVNGQVIRASDAHDMAASSFGSPVMWAIVWLLWSLAMFYIALRLRLLRQHGGEEATTDASTNPGKTL